jgi:hypothetical protein
LAWWIIASVYAPAASLLLGEQIEHELGVGEREGVGSATAGKRRAKLSGAVRESVEGRRLRAARCRRLKSLPRQAV